MHTPRSIVRLAASAALLAVAPAWAVDLKLSGEQQMPPVKTSASGHGSVNVSADGAVTGSVTITNMTATAAHIHHGAAGKNGPVIVHMTKTGDNTWTVVPNARLTPEQLKAWQAGELYVNVHSVAHQGGEIRGQIVP